MTECVNPTMDLINSNHKIWPWIWMWFLPLEEFKIHLQLGGEYLHILSQDYFISGVFNSIYPIRIHDDTEWSNTKMKINLFYRFLKKKLYLTKGCWQANPESCMCSLWLRNSLKRWPEITIKSERSKDEIKGVHKPNTESCITWKDVFLFIKWSDHHRRQALDPLEAFYPLTDF